MLWQAMHVLWRMLAHVQACAPACQRTYACGRCPGLTWSVCARAQFTAMFRRKAFLHWYTGARPPQWSVCAVGLCIRASLDVPQPRALSSLGDAKDVPLVQTGASVLRGGALYFMCSQCYCYLPHCVATQHAGRGMGTACSCTSHALTHSYPYPKRQERAAAQARAWTRWSSRRPSPT